MRLSPARIVPLTKSSSTLLSHSRLPPRLLLSPPKPPAVHSQTRPLFSLPDLLTSTLGPSPLRHLSHSTTLPYAPQLLFATVAAIDLYPSFLPFTLASTVSARDPATRLPTRATLRVGYAPFHLQADWESVVRCDRAAGVVEARSAEPPSTSDPNSTGEEALFEVLRTRWEITPADTTGTPTSHAKLDLHVQFRSPVYDQMFARVEGRVAQAVVAAFEKRVAELAALQVQEAGR